ncbi:MAG: hypothetical protein ABFS21_06685 [Actinomycetota bacterium]
MKRKRSIGVSALTLWTVAALSLGACTSGGEPTPSTLPVDDCAHVIDATVEASTTGYRVAATVRSADTGWEQYADAWEVRDESGAVLGTRVLAHPHVDEQPFTRSLDGVDIPPGTTSVEIAARDSVHGFCGDTLQVSVPER